MTNDPLQIFNSMAQAIVSSAAETQLGSTVLVTTEPKDVLDLEIDDTSSPQTVRGHFAVLVDGGPGALTATLAPSDEAGHYDFQLVVRAEGAEEETVFTATVEDTVGLAETYRALLATKADEQNDLA
ncbi:hypothetical protein [Roseomonas indoligenes]|uniref:Uncharacterized protein n=1 Tax=Roseomonas indoligenes TaxID=2820811 RepID=A0A940S559_9PROT|nr:hypothetical protein [Pararoseomonas indoligenes]MBP0494051.1 hypothetical protein [Pararoseomonas indoligenes]